MKHVAIIGQTRMIRERLFELQKEYQNAGQEPKLFFNSLKLVTETVTYIGVTNINNVRGRDWHGIETVYGCFNIPNVHEIINEVNIRIMLNGADNEST